MGNSRFPIFFHQKDEEVVKFSEADDPWIVKGEIPFPGRILVTEFFAESSPQMLVNSEGIPPKMPQNIQVRWELSRILPRILRKGVTYQV